MEQTEAEQWVVSMAMVVGTPEGEHEAAMAVEVHLAQGMAVVVGEMVAMEA